MVQFKNEVTWESVAFYSMNSWPGLSGVGCPWWVTPLHWCIGNKIQPQLPPLIFAFQGCRGRLARQKACCHGMTSTTSISHQQISSDLIFWLSILQWCMSIRIHDLCQTCDLESRPKSIKIPWFPCLAWNHTRPLWPWFRPPAVHWPRGLEEGPAVPYASGNPTSDSRLPHVPGFAPHDVFPGAQYWPSLGCWESRRPFPLLHAFFQPAPAANALLPGQRVAAVILLPARPFPSHATHFVPANDADSPPASLPSPLGNLPAFALLDGMCLLPQSDALQYLDPAALIAARLDHSVRISAYTPLPVGHTVALPFGRPFAPRASAHFDTKPPALLTTLLHEVPPVRPDEPQAPRPKHPDRVAQRINCMEHVFHKHVFQHIMGGTCLLFRILLHFKASLQGFNLGTLLWSLHISELPKFQLQLLLSLQLLGTIAFHGDQLFLQGLVLLAKVFYLSCRELGQSQLNSIHFNFNTSQYSGQSWWSSLKHHGFIIWTKTRGHKLYSSDSPMAKCFCLWSNVKC